VKVVVLRNDALAFVELEMKAVLDFGLDIDNPAFAKMAEAVGLPGLTAERPEHAARGLGRVYPRTGAVWPTRA